MRVHIDESGFTGEDLVNRQQPAFVLASVCLSDAESDKLARECFPGIRAEELKHSTLAKRPKGQEMVTNFVKRIKAENCATYIVYKEFCLLTKLVDLWVEPAMHALDVDFYEGGANIAFSNMCFFCLRTFESKGFLTKHLRRFQKMIRERTWKRYVSFWRGIHEDLSRCRKQSVEIMEHFLAAESILGPRQVVAIGDKPLDISLTCALQLAEEWTDRINKRFEFVHDTSSAMSREKWMWDAVVSPELPAAMVGFAHRKRRYPLLVTRTLFEDSKGDKRLQLADILAGATAEWAKGKMGKSERREYCAALENAGIAKAVIGGIWPIPEVERLQALPGEPPVDPLRYFGKVIIEAERKQEAKNVRNK